MSFSELVFQVLLFALAVIIPLWALIAGGVAERLCALFFIIAIVASKLVEETSSPGQAGTLFLAIDGIMALGFLTLALVYHHLWIALMMFTMAGFFSIHAYYEMTGRDLDPTFAILSNLATIFLLASLALGVWTCRRRTAQGA